MIQHPEADPQAARLRQALAWSGEHDCAAAQRQIAVLLDAERAGQDVDAMPAFAALLRHLDRCAACLALYAALAEDLDALLDLASSPPQLPPSPPAFFTPVRQRQTPDSPPAPRT
jgi:predicted anti-sigma-YlaC factor YlaD